MRAKHPRQSLLLRIGALLLTAALIFTLAACKSSDDDGDTTTVPTTGGEAVTTTTGAAPATLADVPVWHIEVRGVPNVTSFSSVDAQYLPKVEVEMTTMNNGFNVTNRYGGVTLRSILNHIYVPNVLSVDAISMDNKTVTYPQQLAMAGDTILAWEIDGVPIDTPNPLRICPKSGAADMYMDNLSVLNVVPFDGTVPTTITTTGPIIGSDGNPIITVPITIPSNFTTNTYNTYIPTTTATTESTTTTTTTTTKPGWSLGSTFNKEGYTGPPTTTKTTTAEPTTRVTASTATTSTTYNVFG